MFLIKLCRTNPTNQLLDNCILQAPIFIVQARGLTKLSRNLLKQENNKPAQPNQIPTNRKHGRSQPAPILIQQRSLGWTYLDDSQITTGEKLQPPGAFPISSESLPLAPAQEKKPKQNRSSQHLLPGLGGHVNRRRPCAVARPPFGEEERNRRETVLSFLERESARPIQAGQHRLRLWLLGGTEWNGMERTGLRQLGRQPTTCHFRRVRQHFLVWEKKGGVEVGDGCKQAKFS
jgi:hypothetical protein